MTENCPGSAIVMSIMTRTSSSAGADRASRVPLTLSGQPMSRRGALIGIAGALLPSAVYGQKPTTTPHVGWLSAGSEPDPFLDAFREGLRALGYVVATHQTGRDFVTGRSGQEYHLRGYCGRIATSQRQHLRIPPLTGTNASFPRDHLTAEQPA